MFNVYYKSSHPTETHAVMIIVGLHSYIGGRSILFHCVPSSSVLVGSVKVRCKEKSNINNNFGLIFSLSFAQ